MFLSLFGLDLSLAIAQIDLSRSLDSLSCGYSSWIALSQLLGADRSLTVTRIDLSRSLDSLSCSYSTLIALLWLPVTDNSLAVTRRRSFSRSRLDQSLAVTRIDLSQSLDSLSCSYSARITLLRLLDTDRSLAVTRHG
ncbi:hypothetical protein HID58_051526 [Brassica napus]|uniref:Uncharacterized protein n=1 Tax=Brassica napus TaxID=3708 RepID=A0ABQ8A993_BRANA|nr:hypothetical protein HID58_051526 [Brassica napus]